MQLRALLGLLSWCMEAGNIPESDSLAGDMGKPHRDSCLICQLYTTKDTYAARKANCDQLKTPLASGKADLLSGKSPGSHLGGLAMKVGWAPDLDLSGNFKTRLCEGC